MIQAATQINIQVTPEQKKAWKQAALDAGIPLRELVAAAVDLHISPSRPKLDAPIQSPWVEVKTEFQSQCDSILRVLYPQRVNFTKVQMADAGYFIKRIGFQETLDIARWASSRITLKDLRIEKWRNVCFKKYKESIEVTK